MDKIALLNFDKDKGLIEPSEQVKKIEGFPEKFVLTFFTKEVNDLFIKDEIEKILELKSEMGLHPVYKFKDKDIGLFPMGIGGPLSVGLLEELIAYGANKFIACGGAGVLVDKQVGSIIIPNMGLREEGTSFHYMEPSRYVELDKKIVEDLEKHLIKLDITYTIGKTWTTDAFYRETASKVEEYRNEGILTVEMEFASLVALCKFRKVYFGQYLYAGDSLVGEIWDSRKWQSRESNRLNMIEICKLFLVDMI